MSLRTSLLAALLAAASLAAAATAPAASTAAEADAPASPAPTTPATPAGRVFDAWLAAFNSADALQVQAFESAHGDPPQPPDEALALRARSGGFDVLRFERSEPTTLVVLLQERASPTSARLELSVSADDPPRLRGISLQAVPPSGEAAATPPPRGTQAQALAALIARADALAAADRFSGVLLVARGDTVLLRRAWGLADRAAGAPATPEARFRIGSMNKMFTAVATLQLVQDGRLALDDTVGKHLPDYPNRDLASRVTVRQLLTHSGGTGDIFGPAFDRQRLALREPADYIALYGTRGVQHEPGARFEYSNYGYLLLGALIEAVTGRRYDDVLQDRVFRPAGMADTGARPETEAVPRRAAGYTRRVDAWISNADTLPWRGTPAGGGYSTVDDLLRFAQALQAGRLLSPALLDQATRAQAPDEDYGYGFGVRGEGPARFHGHSGGADGMNGDLRIFPALGVVVVALSNLDPPTASRLVGFYALRMPVTP
jgi:CubicO group peptidase (beta-lactamase class C family)